MSGINHAFYKKIDKINMEKHITFLNAENYELKKQITVLNRLENHSWDSDPQCCPICMNNITIIDQCTTECGHKFCLKCLATSLQQNEKCPTCRKKIVGDIPSSIVSEEYMNESYDDGFSAYDEGFSEGRSCGIIDYEKSINKYEWILYHADIQRLILSFLLIIVLFLAFMQS